MAGKLTLKLLASVFDQAQDDSRDPDLKRYVQGDVFEARDQAEYDRLIAADAAVDPEREQELKRQDLERRRAALEAERAQLDAQLSDLPSDDPANLKGQALDKALDDAGLSKDGTADEKRARLAEHLQAQG